MFTGQKVFLLSCGGYNFRYGFEYTDIYGIVQDVYESVVGLKLYRKSNNEQVSLSRRDMKTQWHFRIYDLETTKQELPTLEES